MTREEFLLKTWRPYPALPLSHNISGRILNVSQHKASLDDGSSLELTHEWTSILRVGDIISAKVQQNKTLEICLLAPKMNSLSWPKINCQTQAQWMSFLQDVRHFFFQKKFVEVQTPSLVKCPGTEVFLEPFATQLRQGQKTEDLFLPTSPELHLKKLLCRGYRQIFEIRPCFRNGEVSATHQPEFYMLEWYRAYADLESVKKDLKELLQSLSGQALEFKSVSICDLFEKYIGKKLFPDTDFLTLKQWALDLGLPVHEYSEWDDIFYLIYLEKIESHLQTDSTNQPVFVEKYPPSQAAYARLGSDGWSERFELYWQGLELCNAFHEVNDPQLQQRRMLEDLNKKEKLKKSKIDLDIDFFEHLENGMPPAGGVALGLERLFMALYRIKNISDLKLFPYQ